MRNLYPIAAACLGNITSAVRRVQQRRHVDLGFTKYRHTDTHANGTSHAVPGEFIIGNALAKLFREVFCGVGLTVLENHRELVTSEPGEGIAVPQQGGRSFGHTAQKCISSGVAGRIIDFLEPVQIKEEQGMGTLAAAVFSKQPQTSFKFQAVA